MTGTYSDPSRRRQVPWGWLIAGLVALPYFVFSLVLVLNSIGNATGVVWLPSFPAAYYQLKTLLELPLQPYFALFNGFRSSPGTTYFQYTVASRGPIVALTLLLLVFAVSRLARLARGRCARRVALAGAGT